MGKLHVNARGRGETCKADADRQPLALQPFLKRVIFLGAAKHFSLWLFIVIGACACN